jgi:hypothetical protein
MFLPDKIVIDLYQLDLIVEKLAKLLKNILKITSCGQVVDVGNDIDYALKDITSFKKKLTELVNKESKKYQSDIFGNTILSFSSYRYVEMLFSEDYKEINSVRMLGENKDGTFNRYTFFNTENIFDPTTITLLYNADDILENIEEITGEEAKYIEFLQKYFTPFPILHQIKQKDLKCLDNVSKKYDDGKDKSFDEYRQQTKTFESIDLKTNIFDKRINSSTNISSLTFVLPQIEEILKKIETYEAANDPKRVIEIIQSSILDKYNIGDITSFIFDGFNLVVDPYKFISELKPIDIIKKIDELPKTSRDKVYSFMRDGNGPIDLDSIIFQLEDFITQNIKCDFRLSKAKKNIKITNIFKKMKLKFPKIYTKIEARFNSIFPKESFLNELPNLVDFNTFKIEIPKIEIPKFKIPNFNISIEDLFGDFSKQIDTGILNIVSSLLTEITRNLLELLNSLNKLDDFAFENMFPLPGLKTSQPNVPKYQTAFNEDWLLYVEYVYRLIIETDKLRTQPQLTSVPADMINNRLIREKIKNRKITKPLDNCEPAKTLSKTIVSKKELKKRKINTIQDALLSSDIDSLLEKIKNYQHSDIHDYFRTAASEDDSIVGIMRYIAASLKDTPNEIKPKLPMSSSELIKKTSDMVEQIETILNQQEINSLLNGSYSEETAEIVRNISKINFPDLTYRVDPIKYFRMLGKVIGSKNNPKFDYKQALSGVGVLK